MDVYEATKIVYSRIQSLDPDNAAKIMGLLLIQGDDKEMIRLAFLPEALIHSVVLKARNDLGLLPLSPSTPSRYGHLSPSSWAHWELSISDELIGSKNESDLLYSELGSECRSPSGFGAVGWGPQQRRGSSAAELYLSEGAGLGWRPCLYYQRGYCKNGIMCRFQHGLGDDGKVDTLDEQQCHELLMRSKSQRAMPSAAPFGYGAVGSLPSSTLAKCMGFFHNDDQRAASVAAAMMLNVDEAPHKFAVRHRLDYASMVNPSSRQIYLTFPADSTFREEDVSNYFSIYGPVQDVRIPYQQKRMFGFVTFIYPETVKLILAKGNPHFVCDARVLVKPYKEKGKVPDKKLQQQQQQLLDRGDFSGCNTPTCLDSPYDLQNLGARVLFNDNHELLLRRKLEEQQRVADLQQAVELQQRRFMGLQLLDIKNRNLTLPISSLSPPNPISTPTTTPSTISSTCTDEFLTEEKCSSPASEDQQKASAASGDKVESINVNESTDKDGDFQESVEHSLPDSPFETSEGTDISSSIGCLPSQSQSSINDHLIASAIPLFPTTSAIDMASFKSCLLHMPRFPSGHGAVGM